MDEQELTRFYELTKHISNAEVEKDIADTLAEIRLLETRERVLRMELQNVESGIRKRREFVKKLDALQLHRLSVLLNPPANSPAPPAQA